MENAEALIGSNMVRFGQVAVACLELMLGVLLFMTSVILLIACAKVTSQRFANQKSANSSGTITEIAAATPLGRASKRIVVQLLAESLLLGFVGGGVGLYAAWDGIRTALAVFPAQISTTRFLGMGAEVIFPTLIALLSVRILFARRPILRIRHPNWNEARKAENQNPVALHSAHPTVYRSRGSAYAP